MRIPENPSSPVDPRNLESMRAIWKFIIANIPGGKRAGHESLTKWAEEVRQVQRDGLPSRHTGRPNYPR